MKADKHSRQFAKRLLTLSQDAEGTVDPERVSAVLAALKKSPPRNYKQVLKSYLYLVRREIARRTAIIEHAGPIDPEQVESIRQSMTQRYGYPITTETRPNPQLFAGLRVRIGDDVYDASALGRLAQLSSAA
ncbi:MAG: F0F1 ATP synthase subunit delta [Verrucomicrobiota bacterium]